MLEQSYKILDQLRLPHGLYLASPSIDYSHIWIRDCFYMAMPYLNKNDGHYEKTYHRLLDMFREYEWKLDIRTEKKPQHSHDYIHARYSAHDVKEIPDQEWGHAQHDSIGAFLFGIAKGLEHDKEVLRDEHDLRIIVKLVKYLACVQYWHDPDNGVWEENREVHHSSVGACIAGLLEISHFFAVPLDLIFEGVLTLDELGIRESITKDIDLAQLSLIYPFNLYEDENAKELIEVVERKLLRSRGVIRYEGDSYYSTYEKDYGRNYPKEFYFGTEAEWTFGLPWLALCHLQVGNVEKAYEYITATESVMLEDGVLPELYYASSNTANQNSPLGWSQAMYILAVEAYEKITGSVLAWRNNSET